MVMKWYKFKGTIKKHDCVATIEMMDLPDPFWEARFSWLLPESTSHEVKAFEEGELEQAHEWCVKQVENYETRRNQRAGS